MHQENCSVITEVFIIGFQNLHGFKFSLFFLFIIMYIITFLENLLIIGLVITSIRLQSPMYILLSILSLCEILYITNFVPKMLDDMVTERGVISVAGCIAQLNIFGTLGGVECLLFALMSYDRYLAISKPLRYSAFISNTLCFHFVIWFWIISFCLVLIISVSLSQLKFCAPNVIDHFYCDLNPLVKLSYSDTSLIQLAAGLISAILTLIPFILIILSYACILYTILHIQSSVGRQKAFSTCSSHLFVVIIYYGTLISIYVLPGGAISDYAIRGLCFVYILVTPFLNPLIYTLRNQEIHCAIKSKISEIKSSFEL